MTCQPSVATIHVAAVFVLSKLPGHGTSLLISSKVSHAGHSKSAPKGGLNPL